MSSIRTYLLSPEAFARSCGDFLLIALIQREHGADSSNLSQQTARHAEHSRGQSLSRGCEHAPAVTWRRHMGAEHSSSERMRLRLGGSRTSGDLSAPASAGPAKRARAQVVRDATKLFVADGWLALTLFGAVLLFLILQR
jgi:hypothetical protein